MLDEKDIQILKQMFEEQEARIDARFAEQEARLDAKTDQKIAASENRMFAYIESKIEPQLKLLAEGQQAILEKLVSKERVDNLEARVSTLEQVVTQHSKDIKKLKEAI